MSDMITVKERHSRIDLTDFHRREKEEITELASRLASESDTAPGLWVLELGESSGAGTALLDTLEPLCDLVYAIMRTGSPVASLVRDTVWGQSLALSLFSMHSIADRNTKIKIIQNKGSASDMAAAYALSIKLGTQRAEALVNTGSCLDASDALKAGIVAEVSADVFSALDEWMDTAVPAQGNENSRLIYQASHWRFNAAFRTGLIELEDLILSGEDNA